MVPLIPIMPVLADVEGAYAVIVIVITVIGWVAKLVSNKNQKGPPVINRPRPPARPRDDRLQQEINIFMDDVGKGRSKPGPARAAGPAARPGAGKLPPAPPAQRKPAPTAKRSARRPRPGEDIAARQPPVTETLGTSVKEHVSQALSDKVSQEVQQRLAPRVEQRAQQDLGPSAVTGAGKVAGSPPPGPPPLPSPQRFAEMLRNPATVQQAMVLNLILSPPVARKGLARR
jgi:hypothetical protein